MAKESGDKKKTRRPTAAKREIQNSKRRANNRAFKSRVRTAVRQLEDSVSKKDKAAMQEALTNFYSLMDKGVKKGIYKANNANRNKSKLAAKVAAAS